MSDNGRVCPQCGYVRQSQDIAPEYECPRCGIVYAKYAPKERFVSGSANGTVQKPAPFHTAGRSDASEPLDIYFSGEQQLASLSWRGLAAAYTMSKLIFYGALASIPLAYWIYFGKVKEDLTSLIIELIIACSVGVFLAFYAFIYRPLHMNGTWGQCEYALDICRKDGSQKPLRWTNWMLRYMGNGIAFMFYPITLAVFIAAVCTRAKIPSIADRFSGTRQYGPDYRPSWRDILKPLKPYLLALLIFSGGYQFPTALMEAYSIHAEKAKRAESIENSMIRSQIEDRMNPPTPRPGYEVQALNVLFALQTRYYSEEHFYTTDLESLLARYGGSSSKTWDGIRKRIRDGSIRAGTIDRGIRISVETESDGVLTRELYAR